MTTSSPSIRNLSQDACRAVTVHCLILMILILTQPAQLAAQHKIKVRPPARSRLVSNNDGQISVDTDLVTLNVTVTDAFGRYVPGLAKSDFTILDDQTAQEISFFGDEDAPVSIAVIMDVSGSMSGDKITRAREALSRFIQTSHEKDEYTLISFNAHVSSLLDRTRDADGLLSVLAGVIPRGQTAIYDAVYLGLAKLERAAYARRAILLISDGEDNSSRYTLNEVRRRVEESDVSIYTIGVMTSASPKEALLRHGEETLKTLASSSGGKAFFPANTSQMDEAFERIALELRHQYSIGYRPANFVANGKWHRFKVRVRAPGEAGRLFVRSRAGYYASAAPR